MTLENVQKQIASTLKNLRAAKNQSNNSKILLIQLQRVEKDLLSAYREIMRIPHRQAIIW